MLVKVDFQKTFEEQENIIFEYQRTNKKISSEQTSISK